MQKRLNRLNYRLRADWNHRVHVGATWRIRLNYLPPIAVNWLHSYSKQVPARGPPCTPNVTVHQLWASGVPIVILFSDLLRASFIFVLCKWAFVSQISPHLNWLHFISELSALWLITATANWVALQPPSSEMRSVEMMWDPWYEESTEVKRTCYCFRYFTVLVPICFISHLVGCYNVAAGWIACLFAC